MEAGTTAAGLELRPLRVTEIVDRAVRLYAKNAVAVWRIAVPLIVVVEVIFALIDLSALPTGAFVQNGHLFVQAGTSTGSYNAAVGLEVVILGLIVLQVLNGALLRVYSDTYLGRKADSRAAFRFATRHLLGLILVAVLVAVVVAIGLIGILIGAVYLWVALSVAFAAYVVEGKRGFAALRRSMELVRGRWWATFGALLLVAVIVGIATFALPAVLQALESGTNSVSPTAYVILGRLANLIAYVLVAPLSAAVTVTIYFDLRVRKEAFDLQQLGEHLGITSAAGATPKNAVWLDYVPPAAPPAGTPSGDDPFGTGYTP